MRMRALLFSLVMAVGSSVDCASSKGSRAPNASRRAATGSDTAPSNALDAASADAGMKLQGPNDLAVRAEGTIYVSDLSTNRLYRISPAGQLFLISNRSGSNGVALAPDEKTLYLNAGSEVVKYGVNPDGTTTDEAPFGTGLVNADGITVDCAGNVYTAQYGGTAVAVFAPDGTRLGSIELGVTQVTNVAFGGPDRTSLLITAGGNGLWTVVLDVPGLPY